MDPSNQPVPHGYSYQSSPMSQGSIPVLPGGQWLPAETQVNPVAGTPFGVALLLEPPVISGLSIGSMMTGIASIVVSLFAGFLGLFYGIKVAGAFLILAIAFSSGALVLGFLGLWRIRDAGTRMRMRGREMAISGLVCGGSGIFLVILGFIVAVADPMSNP